jgi:hypothetical protein
MEKKKTGLMKILLRLKNNIFAHAFRFTICISLYDYPSMLQVLECHQCREVIHDEVCRVLDQAVSLSAPASSSVHIYDAP